MRPLWMEFGSHKLVLEKAIARVSTSVLELGAGDYSTPLIHTAAERGVKVLTIDDNKEWFDKYKHLQTDLHDFRFISSKNIQKFYDNDTEQWGLVSVDNGSWDNRFAAIKKYKDVADYMVIHDCTVLPGNGIGKTLDPMILNMRHTGRRDYSGIFKYWIEFFVRGWGKQTPPTLIGSNKIDLKGFKVRHMIVSGKN